mmetsp:Transcript_39411/g.99889  ORF Transcript_39411/g.99889 Transcript_39411/m.99889 type:complete len:244 (-) Transcript_39411:1751-2482(-)
MSQETPSWMIAWSRWPPTAGFCQASPLSATTPSCWPSRRFPSRPWRSSSTSCATSGSCGPAPAWARAASTRSSRSTSPAPSRPPSRSPSWLLSTPNRTKPRPTSPSRAAPLAARRRACTQPSRRAKHRRPRLQRQILSSRWRLSVSEYAPRAWTWPFSWRSRNACRTRTGRRSRRSPPLSPTVTQTPWRLTTRRRLSRWSMAARRHRRPAPLRRRGRSRRRGSASPPWSSGRSSSRSACARGP